MMEQMRQKFFVVVMMLFVGLGTAIAQQGFLKGKITDNKTGEELVGAAVVVDGTTTGTITDFMGEYTMPPLDAGTYTIRVQYISYDPQVFNNVVINAGEETLLNIQLASATMDIEEVAVVAKANRESENMLLMDQKKAIVATQAIGAQELSRKGVGDAEGAVTKVSGISKQEGVKNVFVRGLGDRYNATSLNGFPVPSEDPEYKNISLDFFSSDIIESVGVNKVFDSKITADVGGANINVNSKSLVGDSELNIGIKGSANTKSVNEEFLMPDGINNLGFAQNTESPSSGDTYAFKNSLDPTSQDLQIGKGFGFSGGKKYLLGAESSPLTFYLVGNYSSEYGYKDGVIRETTTNGTIFRDQSSVEYEITSSHIGMANVQLNTKKYNFSYNFLAIHTAKGALTDDYGFNGEVFQSAEDETGLVRRQQNNDNTLLVNQFQINRDFNKRWSVDLGVAYNYINGKEPDRRVNYLSYTEDNTLEPLRGSGRQHRYFGDLKEKDLNACATITYNLSDDADNLSNLKIGYKGRFLTDDYISNSWDNARTQSTLPQLDLIDFSLDEIFNQEEFEAGHFINKEYNVSTYTVDKNIHSVFGELNFQLGSKLVLDLGLKADVVSLNIDYNVNDGADRDSNALDEFYFLPSLNLKYSLNNSNALRFGFSKTYTLPQSKEISPLLYEGRQWSSQGNPDLIPSSNYNIDLKWDYYLTPTELISFTAFGKLIQDPISRVEVNSAGGFLSYANIAKEATLAGVEVEIRKNIFSSYGSDDSNTRKKLSTGINFSYITTGVDVEAVSDSKSSIPLDFTNTKTELEGASPILLNADISYQFKKNDFELNTSVVVNQFSDRIYSVGVSGYNDVEESGLTTLDFVASSKLNKHWGLSIKAKNLLDPEYQLKRKASGVNSESIVLSSFKKGITLSMGISYKL